MKRARLRAIVAQAIRSGEIVRPSSCSECGTTEDGIVGHHDDYRRALVVRWLCYSCHMKHHYEAGDISRKRPRREKVAPAPISLTRIADRIRTAREMRSLSVDDAAALVGTTRADVEALERGSGSMLLPAFLLLCDACGITPSTALR